MYKAAYDECAGCTPGVNNLLLCAHTLTAPWSLGALSLQISGPLLLKAFQDVAGAVHKLLNKTEYITITMDGWSRTQGSTHIINYMGCGPGLACSWMF